MSAGTFVLFDFDGVIADTFAMASALAKRVCKENTIEKYKSAFEGNIYDSVEKDKPGGRRPDHGEGCEHEIDWWDEYQKSFEAGVSPFEGVVPAIRAIAQEHSLIIVSSGSASFIKPFLEKCDIADLFLDILDVDVHTHKTKKIEIIFEKYGVTAADCVFITDTLGDIREANEHALGTIAVAWGFHSHETLEKGVPFRIVDEPSELPDAVNDYFTVSTGP